MRTHRAVLPLTIVFTLGLALSGRAARAQYLEWAFNGAPQAATLHTSYVLTKTALDLSLRAATGSSGKPGKPSRRAAAPAPTAARPASTVTSGDAKAAAALAKAYPKARRAEASRLFAQLLEGYAKIEESLQLPHGDVAGAAALFLVASYEGYRDVSVDPSLYALLIQQVRAALATAPAFAEATDAQRRETYEQLAIVGMFTAAVRAQLGPDAKGQLADNLRASSAQYLRQFLSVEPDKVRLDARGLAEE